MQINLLLPSLIRIFDFGEVGKMPYLAQRFHLTVDDIVQKTLKAIKRKK